MGRPLGALKGRTEQANEFALWLRKITSGVTVRTLEEDFPYGKSSWSGFRDASRLPSADLVEQVAACYLREPVMRKRQLEIGLDLLTAAHQAAKDLEGRMADRRADLSATLTAHRRLDPMTAALLRLDDARLRQIEAMQKLAASERRREELEAMVSVLEQRITVLESEREQAREETWAELQRELGMSLEYRRQADEKLKHARRAEERARQLRLAAEKQVARERAALLRVDRDNTADTTALPSSPNNSVAEELQLPHLDHIRELLNAAQKQLDAQDGELDELGEQLGTQAQHPHDDPDALHIVWRRNADEATNTGDVPTRLLDNAENPLTSADGAGTVREIEPAPGFTSHIDAAAGRAVNPSHELVGDLDTVRTQEALSSVLSRLLRRTGVSTIGQLTEVLPTDMKDEVFHLAVGRWVDGDDLPDSWPHLETLVRIMGATDDEVAAFRQAYDRVIDSRFAGSGVLAGDLADLAPFTRMLRGQRKAKARAGEWIVAGTAPIAVAAATTAFTAALQAPHGSDMVKLVVYGTFLTAVCAFFLLVTARVTARCTGQGRHVLQKSLSAASLMTGVMAVPGGLVLPWLLESDAPGRWFAHLIGLV